MVADPHVDSSRARRPDASTRTCLSPCFQERHGLRMARADAFGAAGSAWDHEHLGPRLIVLSGGNVKKPRAAPPRSPTAATAPSAWSSFRTGYGVTLVGARARGTASSPGRRARWRAARGRPHVPVSQWALPPLQRTSTTRSASPTVIRTALGALPSTHSAPDHRARAAGACAGAALLSHDTAEPVFEAVVRPRSRSLRARVRPSRGSCAHTMRPARSPPGGGAGEPRSSIRALHGLLRAAWACCSWASWPLRDAARAQTRRRTYSQPRERGCDRSSSPSRRSSPTRTALVGGAVGGLIHRVPHRTCR